MYSDSVFRFVFRLDWIKAAICGELRRVAAICGELLSIVGELLSIDSNIFLFLFLSDLAHDDLNVRVAEHSHIRKH